MGDLLIEAEEHLLPQDLADDLPLRLVAGLPVREELGPGRRKLLQLRHQFLQAVGAVGGDGQDGLKAVPGLMVSRDHRQQLRRLHGVDLVDAEEAGDLLLPDAVDECLLRPASTSSRAASTSERLAVTTFTM